MIGRQKGRIYDMPTAAAAAALCLLIFQPLAIFQASMQLSFGAVLGISLVGDIFKKILMPSSDKTTVRINRFCSVMGLSIAMLPVLLYHYYQYPLYAILLNQLVIPFAGILLVSPAVALCTFFICTGFWCCMLKGRPSCHLFLHCALQTFKKPSRISTVYWKTSFMANCIICYTVIHNRHGN